MFESLKFQCILFANSAVFMFCTLSVYTSLQHARMEKLDLKCQLDALRMETSSHNKKGNSIFSEVRENDLGRFIFFHWDTILNWEIPRGEFLADLNKCSERELHYLWCWCWH